MYKNVLFTLRTTISDIIIGPISISSQNTPLPPVSMLLVKIHFLCHTLLSCIRRPIVFLAYKATLKRGKGVTSEIFTIVHKITLSIQVSQISMSLIVVSKKRKVWSLCMYVMYFLRLFPSCTYEEVFHLIHHLTLGYLWAASP